MTPKTALTRRARSRSVRPRSSSGSRRRTRTPTWPSTSPTPLECLVATILSAQCTDERVNIVTKTLFAKYKTAEDWYLAVPEDGACKADDPRPTGFFNQKTKSIRGACARIVEVYGGTVPNTMEDLIMLPGVARKTANIVLGNSYGVVEGIAVDTHVRRLAERLGFSAEKDPDGRARPDAPRPEAMVRLHVRDHRPRPGDLRRSHTAMRRVPGERPLSVEPGVMALSGADGRQRARRRRRRSSRRSSSSQPAPHTRILSGHQRPFEALSRTWDTPRTPPSRARSAP